MCSLSALLLILLPFVSCIRAVELGCLTKGSLANETRATYRFEKQEIRCESDEWTESAASLQQDGGICGWEFLWPETVVCRRRNVSALRNELSHEELRARWSCIADGSQWSASVHLKCRGDKLPCAADLHKDCYVSFDPFHSLMAHLCVYLTVILLCMCLVFTGFLLYASHCFYYLERPHASLLERSFSSPNALVLYKRPVHEA